MSSAHPFTCNTCQVAYRTTDLQKGHMKSDWHRYNLKRRVASLPPISSETFTEKVLQARAQSNVEAEKAMFEKSCEACQKTYYSENSFQNHLLSQKHKAREAAVQKQQDTAPSADEVGSVVSSSFSLGEPLPEGSEGPEGLDSEAEEEFSSVVEGLQRTNLNERPSPVKRPSNPEPPAQLGGEGRDAAAASPGASTPTPPYTTKSCLFCNYSSPTVALNAHHMERFHGMFIPERQYLVDLDGLMKRLEEVVHEGRQCLFCGTVKVNAFAVQTHMRDKGHCRIPYETEEEQVQIGDFYDFRSTYSDGEESDEDEDEGAGPVKLGARRKDVTTGEDGEVVMGEDEGWETDSSASSLDSADLTAVPAEGHDHQFERLHKHRHHSRDDPRHHLQADGWHCHAHKPTRAVFYDEYEMHLPSGKSVGHRSFNRYYRQNLHRYPTDEERSERLAIEDAKDGDAMEVDGDESAVARRPEGRSRAVVPRGQAGMMGVTDAKRGAAKKHEQRGRSLEQFNAKKTDWAYSKALNNHKSYYYRYNGGG